MFIQKIGPKLYVGRLRITADRWPWQGYGWGGTSSLLGGYAPLNSSGARFGGGWRWKLGVSIGSTTVMVDLLFGMLRFYWMTKGEERK